MAIFRITQNSIAKNSLDRLQQNLARMERLQDQLSSGKQVRRPSEDPAAVVSAMSFRSEVRRTEQYGRNASDALAWLGTIDNTLSATTTQVSRVRELVALGMNGSMDSASRTALAEEVATIKSSILGLANQTYMDKPIFAGTANPAGGTYASNGTFNGNTAAINRTVGSGNATVQVNIAGPTVFGSGATQLFQVLTDIETHLRGGTPADVALLSTDLDNLDANRVNITNKLAEVGARYNRVETMRHRADEALLALKSGLAEVEDIDLPKTMVEVQLQEVAFQAALQATSRVIQPSLLDFLRS